MERKGRKQYRAVLSEEECGSLSAIVKVNASVHWSQHAHILLLADEAREDGGLTDSSILSVPGNGRAKAERVRKRCVAMHRRVLEAAGLETGFSGLARPGQPAIVDYEY